jgi:hypothetical protein
MTEAEQIIAEYKLWKEKKEAEGDRDYEKRKKEDAKNKAAVRAMLESCQYDVTSWIQETRRSYRIRCGYYLIMIYRQWNCITGSYQCIPAAEAIEDILTDPFLPDELSERALQFIDSQQFVYYGRFPTTILSVLSEVSCRIPPMKEAPDADRV